MVEVTVENFEDVVIRGSGERAVVVDFWAEWCGPCKQLGPVLEKLSQEMDFVLAKVDTEKNQELASYFRLSSIPDVRVFFQGKMVDAMQGALAESQLRKRLARFFLSPEELALQEIETLLNQGQSQQALDALAPILASQPGNRKAQYYQAKALLGTGDETGVKAILQGFSEGDDFFREAKALGDLMAFHQEVARKDLSDPTEIEYQQACALALQGQHREALEAFLQIAETRTNWRDGAARKAMLTLFGVLGPKHELTWEFRSRLNTLLFI
ncbi:MAG TPA: tetratricopeptide repeat protein [Fibrobacteraceae bacterium]|nr:tetratricopeptide repeat protein [Fibrobacteraceae bacterium]